MSEDSFASPDRVAVIGMACRAPGAPDVPALWRNLCGGVDSVRRFSAAELARLGVPAALAADATFVPAFGYLEALADFDAGIFGYTDAQAALLDPQHRIFLELAWWALEDAGYDPARTKAQIGVFAGCGANRYLRYHLLGNPAVLPTGHSPEDWDEAVAGATSDYLPTRVAYALGLTGPAVAVQTACSSSLVAVCQAAQSLLDYRCDLALAGGAAVVSTRQAGYRPPPGGTWSTDGICRPFDAAATGQVFGNGGGAVVLRRLADAVDDGDSIYAVLAGWAVNNDGSNRAGFTVPGVAGQAAVVAEALAAAQWDPRGVGFVEGHGSGTAVGDAIELEALVRAFRSRDGEPYRCVLGSLKGSIGNLDAAAGVVSLVKAVLAVQTGSIPPTLHFRRFHPDVDAAASMFTVDTVGTVSNVARGWAGPRRAGVSSFGLGGTNAHVLVEQAPPRPAPDGSPAPPWRLLPLSGADPGGLAQLAAALATHLRDPDTADMAVADLAYTLTVGRRRLPCRASVAGRNAAQAAAALDEIAAGSPTAALADVPDWLREQANAWAHGAEVPAGDGRRVHLPGYPFQRRRHWFDPPIQTAFGVRP